MTALALGELSRRVLDRRHGLFLGLGEMPRTADGGDVFIMGGEIVDPKALGRSGMRGASRQVAGAGLTRDEALMSTLGEGIERYSAQTPQRSCAATYEALGAAAIDPCAFLYYSDAQYASLDFPYKRFDPRTVYSWIDVEEIGSGQRRFAPLQLAALGAERLKDEPLLCQPISTGIACHTRRDRADLTALLEVIERDAFMCTWQLRRAPPSIDLDERLIGALDPRAARLLRRADLSIKLYLLAPEPAPVVMCMVRRENPGAATVGAAARLSLRDAIAKAVVEACHTWSWGLLLAQKPPVRADEVDDFEHHVRFYFDPDNLERLAFFDEGGCVRYEDVAHAGPADLADLVARLAACGHEAFSADLTSPDVAELGFVVSRVLVEDMQPLACGVRNYPLHTRRLRQAASAWGVPFPATLNTDPHPFP